MEYYTYAYLREDGTPYYIGKGKGDRAYSKHRRKRNLAVPPKERILILKQNLTEEDAFKHEIYMIAVFGRKDLGTGILRNLTNGGDGASGVIPWNTGKKLSKNHREKLSAAGRGRKKSEEHKRKIGEAHKGIPAWNKGKRGTCPEHQKEINRKMMKKRYENGYSVSGANNPRAKTWRIIFIDGREIIIGGLQRWATDNGYSTSGIKNIAYGKCKKYRDIAKVELLGP
jgi:hypothetical protein